MEKTKKKANGYAVYLDVKHKKQAQIIDFVDDLNEFYKLLDCDCIDITYTTVCNANCLNYTNNSTKRQSRNRPRSGRYIS
ncbi:MAG: hypothetical protein E7369_02775 [Clostridiales bacterium]|nr:hypothetical protein [Clostridiales bacterium]